MFGLDDNPVLHFHPAKHVGDGYPVAQRDVWRVLREFDGSNCCPPVHYLVHLDAVLVRVQSSKNADL